MAKTKKVALALFNRATFGRVKCLIEEMSTYPEFDVTVILGSSVLSKDYDSPVEYIKRLDNVKFHILNLDNYGSGFSGMTKTASMISFAMAEFLDEHHIDYGIVVADRFETLPAAMAFSYFNIPVIHIQGGEVTNNIDDRVRHAVTKLSDYHFASTHLAKEYIFQMGEERNRVHFVGCPSMDLMRTRRIRRSPKERSKDNYILCIIHPLTDDVSDLYQKTKMCLDLVVDFCSYHNYRALWYYPNCDPGRESIKELIDEYLDKYPTVLKKQLNEEPEEFCKKLASCKFIIGNSSSTIRESAYLGVPAIVIGDRQGFRERADNVITVDYKEDEIKDAMRYQNEMHRYTPSRLYGDGHSSKAICYYILKDDPTRKGTLTYPFTLKYNKSHFGDTHKQKYERTSERYKITSTT